MYKFFSLFSILLLWCCQAENRTTILLTQVNNEIQLFGESLNLSDSLAYPTRIYYFDSLIFLNEASDNFKMYIVNPNPPEIINKLIPKGRGPGEQIGTFFFTYSTNSNKIYSFDVTLRRYLELNLDSIRTLSYKPQKSYSIPSLDVLQGSMLNDSTFIVLGFAPDFRIASFTSKGTIRKWGISPDPKRKMNAIINEAYTGTLRAAPSGDKFVIACRYADQLEIFNLNDSSQFFVKGPSFFEPSYEIKTLGKYKVLSHKKDEIYAYTDVAVTNDRIYALYSGKAHESPSLYCNTIRVFSWNGDYLFDYILDKGVLSFTLDKKNKIIYGITSEPGAEIYKFKLTEQ